MKLLKHIPVLLVIVSCTSAPVALHNGFEYPMIPARLLADSLTEKCAVCVKDLRQRAYGHLGKEFIPGTIVHSSPARPFVKMPGGDGRFTLDGFQEKTWDKKDERGGDIHLPLVLFRFHTARSHLVGVAAKDYSVPGAAEQFRTLPPQGRFQGTATIINFSYGDGPSFTYSPAENIIFVHCRLDEAATTGKAPD